MRTLRIAVLAAALGLIAMLSTGTAEAAKPCNQYPTFIEPIICRIT